MTPLGLGLSEKLIKYKSPTSCNLLRLKAATDFCSNSNLLNRFGQMQQMMKKMGKFQRMMSKMGGPLPGMLRR